MYSVSYGFFNSWLIFSAFFSLAFLGMSITGAIFFLWGKLNNLSTVAGEKVSDMRDLFHVSTCLWVFWGIICLWISKFLSKGYTYDPSSSSCGPLVGFFLALALWAIPHGGLLLYFEPKEEKL